MLALSLGIRAATNSDITQLIGVLLSPTIRLRRTIIVHAPIHEVYAFWTHFENYAKFMSYVEDVRVGEQGMLQWQAKGPAGMGVRWNSRITELRTDELVSWSSAPRSILSNTGKVELRELDRESSELDVELSYELRGGALGYALVHALGFDRRDRIDSDLERMKELIEGKWQRFYSANPLHGS